jgi:HPt (histidine-containing phosphotransfer) domain-containing protein
LRAARSLLQRAEAQRQQLEAELERAHAARESEARERRRLEAELDRRAKDQLWAWAEEELRRVQSSHQRAREKLHRVEEDLARALKDREWAEQRQRRTEEELQSMREELQRQRRSGDDRARGDALARPGNGWHTAHAALAVGRTSNERQIATANDNGVGLARDAAATQATSDRLSEAPVDWADALAGVDGDVELLRAIAATFFEDCPRLLRELQAAIDHEELVLVERLAGTLKGGAGSLGAGAAVRAVTRLESAFERGSIPETEEAYIALQLEIELLKPALDALRGGSPVLA